MKSRWMAGACACGMLLAVVACSKQEHAADAGSAEPASAEMASAPAVAADAGAAADTESQLQSAALSQDDGTRRFIRTAHLEFRVRDVHRSALAIENLTARYGGYVARNDVRNEVEDVRRRDSGDGWRIQLTSYTPHADLQLRVPSDRAQAFIRELATQIEFMDRRTFAAVDAQLQLLRQQLAYAREQQAQQSLADVADAPGKTGEKVGAVQARSQALAQRDEAGITRREFEDRVALATIDLSMYQTPLVARTAEPDLDDAMRRDGPGFFVRMGHSLSAGWTGLLSVVVAMTAAWPLWLSLLLALLGVRQWRRWRASLRR